MLSAILTIKLGRETIQKYCPLPFLSEERQAMWALGYLYCIFCSTLRLSAKTKFANMQSQVKTISQK